ncbi:CopD family protein [Fulvivirga lutimaris]|uniref:CopD family protein n=1 Tax=Fulvivirga lutimaris TaxID=1819566 RepID=UPI0012BB977A|nr:CopD family protein [Fulvivirga lutimaris]MTI38192.1 protoporphyrinogen IX oxidase [Fulvivirga lutimaris]
MTAAYLKALHLIFIVTWFAGLFYIVRIFIYQTEANEKPEPDRSILIKEYKKNGRLLWMGITWPSAILTLIFGTSLLMQYPGYLNQGFMHIKLTMVFLLYVYQFSCQYIYKLMQRDEYRYKSIQLRIWNEVATILLVGIVFIIVLKSALSLVWGVIGIILFSVILMMAIRLYKKLREKK